MRWLAPLASWDAPFDPAIHCKNPFKVFSFRMIESEQGDVIKTFFEATVRNFHFTELIGLNQQYYVVVEQTLDDAVPREVCRGRVNNVPVELGETTVRLEFYCAPPREDLALRAAANLIRTGEIDYDPDAPVEERLDAEYYDPVFFSPDAADDPTTVLLARPEFFRIDPITLLIERVSISEGRTVHNVPRGGLKSGGISLQVQNPPKPVSRLRLVCNFEQRAKGIEEFNKVGSLSTYTANDWLANTPKPGDAIGNDTGWTWHSFDVLSVTPSALTHRVTATSDNYGEAAGARLELQYKHIEYSFRAAFDYTQARQEICDITMPVALERPIADQRIEDVETLETGEIHRDHVTRFWEYEYPDTLIRRHYNVGDFVQHNNRRYVCLVEHDATLRFLIFVSNGEGERTRYWSRAPRISPQRSRRSPEYLTTLRGKRSVRYGVNRLRRTVLLRSRYAVLSFSLSYAAARHMSCADAIRIEVPRVGEVLGKITSIERVIEDGKMVANITIASINGDGTDPVVAEPGQQQTGDLAYSTSANLLFTPVDAYSLNGGGPFAWLTENESAAQAQYATDAAYIGLDPVVGIGKNPTRVTIAYKPLVEEDTLTRRLGVATAPLKLPRQIRLLPGP